MKRKKKKATQSAQIRRPKSLRLFGSTNHTFLLLEFISLKILFYLLSSRFLFWYSICVSSVSEIFLIWSEDNLGFSFVRELYIIYTFDRWRVLFRRNNNQRKLVNESKTATRIRRRSGEVVVDLRTPQVTSCLPHHRFHFVLDRSGLVNS